MINILQIIIPDIELNMAILRFVIIQTAPQAKRVNINEKRRPSGRMSILSCFFKTFIKGNIGEKLNINDVIVPMIENISDISVINLFIQIYFRKIIFYILNYNFVFITKAKKFNRETIIKISPYKLLKILFLFKPVTIMFLIGPPSSDTNNKTGINTDNI